MSEIKILLGPMRIPFLILTPSCVLLGLGSAVWTCGNVNIFYLFLVFIGALSAHISVNALNEYFDFKSGLDFKTKRTPFSGGSGALPERPEKAYTGLITGLTTLRCYSIHWILFFTCQRPAPLAFGPYRPFYYICIYHLDCSSSSLMPDCSGTGVRSAYGNGYRFCSYRWIFMDSVYFIPDSFFPRK